MDSQETSSKQCSSRRRRFAVPTGRDPTIAHFSLLRWTPDLASGERLNAGLLLFAEDGSWARFRRRAIKTRSAQLATEEQISVAERWIDSFEAGAAADGHTGL